MTICENHFQYDARFDLKFFAFLVFEANDPRIGLSKYKDSLCRMMFDNEWMNRSWTTFIVIFLSKPALNCPVGWLHRACTAYPSVSFAVFWIVSRKLSLDVEMHHRRFGVFIPYSKVALGDSYVIS